MFAPPQPLDRRSALKSLFATGLGAAALGGTSFAAQPKRPDLVDLGEWQTPDRNQDLRGTCVSHSTIAALEAAHLRAGHGELDFSEEFNVYASKMFWLEKQTTRAYARENKPGFMAGGFATGYIHAMASGFALPLDKVMPYRPLDKKVVPVDKNGRFRDGDESLLLASYDLQLVCNNYNLRPDRFPATELAKGTFYGVKTFEDVSGRDTDQLEAALAAGREVMWNFRVPKSIDDDMEEFLAARRTDKKAELVWKAHKGTVELDGGHAVLLYGYNRKHKAGPVFYMKNSWKGPEARAKLTYDFVRQFGMPATTITEIAAPRKWVELANLGRWALTLGDKKGLLDLYHVPGMAQVNFKTFDVRGANGKVALDRRLGTFFVNGDPLKAYRVNGTLHKDGASIEIDFENANQFYDAKGDEIRLTFTDAAKDLQTGDGAKALRLRSDAAFDGKTKLDDLPEVKKD